MYIKRLLSYRDESSLITIPHWVSGVTDKSRIKPTVPGQQSYHSGDDADQVEHGVRHLALEDPVRVGWGVTGNADGAVDQCHGEVQPHAAQHD